VRRPGLHGRRRLDLPPLAARRRGVAEGPDLEADVHEGAALLAGLAFCDGGGGLVEGHRTPCAAVVGRDDDLCGLGREQLGDLEGSGPLGLELGHGDADREHGLGADHPLDELADGEVAEDLSGAAETADRGLGAGGGDGDED
jgi:hypothetical protein